jgi:hypothetical protein
MARYAVHAQVYTYLHTMQASALSLYVVPWMLSTLILAAYNVLYTYSTLYVALYAVCTLPCTLFVRCCQGNLQRTGQSVTGSNILTTYKSGFLLQFSSII